jgi:hypothetical protein
MYGECLRSARRLSSDSVVKERCPVIASEAKQSSFLSSQQSLDCFVASLLAMTGNSNAHFRSAISPELICPSGQFVAGRFDEPDPDGRGSLDRLDRLVNSAFFPKETGGRKWYAYCFRASGRARGMGAS